jgi:prepilin peptidase CpaA
MNINFIASLPAAIIYILLIIAVATDLKERRIPNMLVFPGALSGVVFHSTIPDGTGFFGSDFGGLGFLASVSGLGMGLVLFFPLYALKTMGAGDVKLMAMVGAFFGSSAIFRIALLTMVAGGVLGLVAALWSGKLAQVFTNIRYMFIHSLMGLFIGGNLSVDKPLTITGRFPYAAAIASGTILYVVMLRFPQWSF